MFDESCSLGSSEMHFVTIDPVERKPTLLDVLRSLNPTLVGDTLYLDSLKIVTRDRLSLRSLEEIVVQSGRNKNAKGHINSIHMNPDLDDNNNPIRDRHVPFDQMRHRTKPKRPIHKHKPCRCC